MVIGLDIKFLEGILEKYDQAITEKNIYTAFKQLKKLADYFKMIKSKHGVLIATEMQDIMNNCMSKINFSKKESQEFARANEIFDKIRKVLEICKIEGLNDTQKLELYKKLEDVTLESELLQESIDESRPPSMRGVGY